LVVNGVETRINFNNGIVSFDPDDPAVDAGISIDIFANGGNGKLRVNIDQSLNDVDIRLKATTQSAPFGIKTAATQATLSDEGFYLSQYRGNRLSSSAQVNSLAHEVLSIDGMNGEDLIVLSSGTGKASLIGAVDTYLGSKPQREIVARVSDEDQRLVRLYDKESGDFIANRSISTNDNFIFNDFDWSFNGEPNSGDEFELLVSTDRKDDASNIVQLMALADYSEASSKGGYSSRYNDLIIDVGFKSKSSEESLKTASTMYDVAVDRKATFSGVDLDTEAARLIEQQQAYQALAKVLGTAKELVDTLLRSM
jgi:flagellar hook-associated protein 1 FlgK